MHIVASSSTPQQDNKLIIQEAMVEVAQVGGKELVLEAIAICAFFHGVTRLFLATGQQEMPTYTYTIMTWFFRIMRWFGLH